MMVDVAEPAGAVYYQGPGRDTEIWGVIQANFIIEIPGQNSREIAVNIGPPVAAFLAEQTGRDDTRTFRDEAARILGECRLNELHALGHQIDVIETVSVDLLNRDPDLLACAVQRLKAAA